MIGNWTNGPAMQSLTQDERERNAREIWGYFQNQGWTLESVSGMLGNMQIESGINPAQWEEAYPIYGAGGFGLVQWTPWTNYTDWAGSGWETNYTKQLDRIMYELNNGLQWIPVAQDGNMSFYDYTQSTQDPGDLAMIFERGYERGTPMESQRRAAAADWYQYLGGAGPLFPHVPVWLLFKIREANRNRGHTYNV